MSLTSQFIGYYKLSDRGCVKVFARPSVSLPQAKVVKGSSNPLTVSALSTELQAIVVNNDIAPVSDINPDIETNLTGYLTATQSDAVANSITNSVKVGLQIAEFGPNKGKGVLVITTKKSGVKEVTETVIESEGGGG